MEKRAKYLAMFETGGPRGRFQVWQGKSNLNEESWKGKLTLNAFYAVDYQVGK